MSDGSTARQLRVTAACGALAALPYEDVELEFNVNPLAQTRVNSAGDADPSLTLTICER